MFLRANGGTTLFSSFILVATNYGLSQLHVGGWCFHFTNKLTGTPDAASSKCQAGVTQLEVRHAAARCCVLYELAATNNSANSESVRTNKDLRHKRPPQSLQQLLRAVHRAYKATRATRYNIWLLGDRTFY